MSVDAVVSNEVPRIVQVFPLMSDLMMYPTTLSDVIPSSAKPTAAQLLCHQMMVSDGGRRRYIRSDADAPENMVGWSVLRECFFGKILYVALACDILPINEFHGATSRLQWSDARGAHRGGKPYAVRSGVPQARDYARGDP